MRRLVAALWFLFSTVGAPASAGQDPDILVKQTTEQVLGELTANREALEQDLNKLYELVDEIIVPHFDFNRMSKLVLGKHWKTATDLQRQQFEDEFKALLVRTYATALFEYTGQKIVYKPLRIKDDSPRAVVQTEILPDDGPAIPMHYALQKAAEKNEWQVYDVRIDGISMVTNYRSTYGRIIESKGIDTLIVSLAQKREASQQ